MRRAASRGADPRLNWYQTPAVVVVTVFVRVVSPSTVSWRATERTIELEYDNFMTKQHSIFTLDALPYDIDAEKSKYKVNPAMIECDHRTRADCQNHARQTGARSALVLPD